MNILFSFAEQPPFGSPKTSWSAISLRSWFGRVAAVLAVVCAFLSPQAQAADSVPGGVYTLMKISGGSLINLGTLEIKGQTYRLNEEGAFAPFTVDGAGNITWSAGLDFLPEGWKLGKSTLGKNEQGKPLIEIHYTSARGAAEVIDAVQE